MDVKVSDQPHREIIAGARAFRTAQARRPGGATAALDGSYADDPCGSGCVYCYSRAGGETGRERYESAKKSSG